jgi:hypothetical protein
MSRRTLPLLLLVLTVCNAAYSQARLAIYGTVGGENSGLPSQGWTTAGMLGLYVGVANLGPLALSVDGRAVFATNSRTFLAGPRVALHFPVFPLKPYSEILIGGSSYDKTSAGLQPGNHFNANYVGGIDTTILPHVDWRIFDFTYGLDTQVGNRQKALTTGLVLRF